ncbi:variable surface protein Vir24-related [Plasmodium vivax]|uniref:Variable surface protein Vir24-related n=1 Tax=Plasmodium vivax (strain Salvador I) TaxID=126793 RepID=A5K936_PLAVS|nr:variable surface protein Vir24-related [Plasmodium vivax]EDL44332.1 variable surface protein Vir24-related [Plasmodium vivax]|eukprot:XP_001614059.1 variable surface protein Vir24-related [Plasmodium vivax Sal-1]
MALEGFEFLSPTSDEENILKNLPSYKIHQKLNEEINKNDYDHYCTRINTYDSQYNGLSTLCKKVAKGLKELTAIDGLNQNADERCSNVTYWMYGQIWKKLNKMPDSINRKSAINIFKDVESTIYDATVGRGNSCYIEFEENFDEWNDQSILYDYNMNYSSILKCNKSHNKDNCKHYCKYVKYINDIYKKYENQCCGSNYMNCGEYFDCNYDPNILINELNCNGNQTETSDSTLSEPEKPAETTTLTEIEKLKHNILRCATVEKENDGSGTLVCSVFRSSPDSFENFGVEPTGRDYTDENQDSENDKVAESSDLGDSDTMHPENEADVSGIEKKEEKLNCKEKHLVRGPEGDCVEPNVRNTGSIGLKVETNDPITRVRFHLNRINNIFSNLEDNKFRISVGGMLTVGIMMTFFVYYKLVGIEHYKFCIFFHLYRSLLHSDPGFEISLEEKRKIFIIIMENLSKIYTNMNLHLEV